VNFFVSSIDLNYYLENNRSHSYFKGTIWSIRSLFTFMQADLVAYNSIIIEITFAPFSRMLRKFEKFRLIILIQIKRSVIIDPNGNSLSLEIVS
jgi:hypothetical protein